MVPRNAAGEGSCGNRSIDRNLKSNGQVMKSPAREGESEVG